ncbi:Serine/threonine-protein kinase [Ophidiomyces ophidiicola]|nr:Serine/threonine-protein kinase [Ophidiomyces ophidiicola]
MTTPHSRESRSLRSGRNEGGYSSELILGKYSMIEEIGKGSFATVYQGIHIKHRTYVAIKAVNIGPLNKKLKDNLKMEIEILKGLQHPHIVSLIDCDESSPSCIHLVMEYCALGDLSLFIRKRDTLRQHELTRDMIAKYPNPSVGGLNEVIVRHFLKQLASALQFLRSKDLIHRDLKPQNLLLNPSPSSYTKGLLRVMPYKTRSDSFTPLVGIASLPMLKIADFGFARSLPSTSLAETLCGSPLYMAPEILRYEKYDAKADLWSVGTVLFEMLLGRSPFRAGNHVDLLRKIEKNEDKIRFPSQTEVSEPMKTLIRSLLKRNPVERVSFNDFFASSVVQGDIPGLAEEDIREQITTPLSIALQAAQNDPFATRSGREPNFEDSRLLNNIAPPSRRLSGNYTRQPINTTKKFEKTDLQRVAVTARKSIITASASVYEDCQTRDDREYPGPSSLPKDSVMRRKISSEKEAQAILERERAEIDLALEQDYVMVEKRAVEVNAFADELAASPRLQQHHATGKHSGALVRRATTTATPQVSSSPRDSPSRAVPIAYSKSRSGSIHQRHASYDPRYGPSPTSATSAISKAIKQASGRLFGYSFSPPLNQNRAGRSPPITYNSYPSCVVGQSKRTQPIDEEGKFATDLEALGNRCNVVLGFAEVKYEQIFLSPAKDSTAGPPNNQEAAELSEAGDTGMTPDATFSVAEEALVLYLKTLALLAKVLDIAGAWWVQINYGENLGKYPGVNTGIRVNNVVQWARTQFNEVLQKAEGSRQGLLDAQQKLPVDHPYHANQVGIQHIDPIAQSPDQTILSSGITAEKLLYDRALELSKSAAISELTGEDFYTSKIMYGTSIQMLEAVLEGEDIPRLRSDQSSEAANPSVNDDDLEMSSIQSEDREIVTKLINSVRTRMAALHKKIKMKEQAASPMLPPLRGANSPKTVASPIIPQASSR